MSKEASTAGRGTGNRLTLRRGTPMPEVYVQNGYKSWLLEFKTWVFRHEVAKYLFLSGIVPPEFTLRPTRSIDGELSLRWTVAWNGYISDYSKQLTKSGQDIAIRAAQGGDLTPLEAENETAFNQAKQLAENSRRINQNKTYLPSLGMTAEEALKRLEPGAYIAAPGMGILRLLPVAPKENFSTDTRWMRKFVKGGYFVWIGIASDSLTLEMTPISSVTQYQRDISWYLRLGDSLLQAQAKFTKQWDEINLRVLTTFAMLLTSSPSLGPRADLSESAFAMASRDAGRMIGRETRPERPFSSVLPQINKIEAVETAIVAKQVYDTLREMKQDNTLSDDERAGLQSISNAVITNLQKRMSAMSQKDFNRSLGTGELGEAIIKKTLELRGYQVVALQNASGQGIDLVAIKMKDNSKGLIVYLEVKSSVNDSTGRLSVDQRESTKFVRDRLERVVAHAGLYKNVDAHTVNIAKLLLAEIDNGRPIGGIKASVRSLSKGVWFTVEFSHWKSSNVPRARVKK